MYNLYQQYTYITDNTSLHYVQSQQDMTTEWAWLVFMRNVMQGAFQGQFWKGGRQKQTMLKNVKKKQVL